MKFGRLEVISAVTVERKTKWLCRCECGNEKAVATASLTTGSTRSCGCLHLEMLADAKRTHGLTGTREYIAWATMKARCFNPKNADFHRYGGRGIMICAEWVHDFPAFLAYVGPKPSPTHSIDRMDNDGHYEPGNVHWATPKQQGNNTCRVRKIEHNGVTQGLTAWAQQTGIPYQTLKQRLNAYGWSVERALTTPVRRWA